MKTRIFTVSLMLMAVVLFSCKKDQEENSGPQEVTFQADQIIPNDGLKSTLFDWNCTGIEPTHASIKIAGTTTPYYPAVYRVEGKLYTQAIKLDPGTYTVEEFFLYQEKGTNSVFDLGTDVVVMAAPAEGSPYAVYTDPDPSFEFTVAKFAKTQVGMQVLCFDAQDYDDFGFGWFEVGEIVLREQIFFGDFCIKHAAEYAGSNYALQPTWGGAQGFIDAPAIFKIDAYKMVGSDWVLLPNNEDFTNNYGPNYGVGAPVKVQYPDDLNITGEQFKFELWILVKVGSSFQYKLFHTWPFSDAEKIPAGNDGVVDFVLGSCNLSNTDLQLAPYQNLPATCDLRVGNAAPGTLGTYFDVTLSNIGPGYDIANGLYGVYCADQGTNINGGSWHPGIGVYSSLLPGLLPAFMDTYAKNNLDKANWLFNHISNYPSAGPFDIQNALWIILDENALFPGSLGNPSPVAIAMAADANANGDGFVPLPGGYAAVVFAESVSVQIIFTMVDP